MARFAPILLLLAMVLAGCGQKGPLYHPDDTAAAERYGQADEASSERNNATKPARAADEEGD